MKSANAQLIDNLAPYYNDELFQEILKDKIIKAMREYAREAIFEQLNSITNNPDFWTNMTPNQILESKIIDLP